MNRRVAVWSALLALALTATNALADDPPKAAAPPKVDTGDTAWMLTSTGLVLLMVPGLALFYGGMVRRKNVLGTMMHSMVALALIGVQWFLFGYALAFGDTWNGLIGWNSNYVGLNGVTPTTFFPGTKISVFVHCMYQGMFAIITPALISGALAERIRFRSYCLFILLWAIVVYDPLAHWVWALKAAPTATNPDATASIGWLGDKGSLDFAGGTVVHISAGFSALAAILLLPRRRGYPQHAMHPNSMVLTLTGAGLLWFGWFGFNGGSALGSNALAGLALTTSQVAAATAALTWMIVEWIHRGKPTALGLASGLVAGLVAITPASGWVSPMSALFIGLAAGVVCYTSVCLKPFIKYDDSLDAFGVHGVGGFLGAVLTGVFVSKAVVNDANGNADPVGVLADGYSAQIGVQLLAAAVSAAYAFVATLVLVKFVDVVSGFSLDAKDETVGLDQAAHGEVGFDMSPTIDGATSSVVAHEPRAAAAPPNGKRHFTVVVEGPSTADLMKSWSGLCQAGVAPPPEFRSLYQQMTTVKGNRFRFRGGDPSLTRQQMQRLFQDRLDGAAVQVHIEE